MSFNNKEKVSLGLVIIGVVANCNLGRALFLNLAYVEVAKTTFTDFGAPVDGGVPRSLFNLAVALGASGDHVMFGELHLELAQGHENTANAILEGSLNGTIRGRFANAYIGDRAFRVGELDRAEGAWQRAGIASARSAVAFYRGSEAHRAGDWSRAAAYYQLAAELDPDSSRAWRKWAEVLLVSGDSAGAIRVMQSLRSRGLAGFEDYLQLGRLLASVDQQRFAEARQWYLHAVTLNPSSPEPFIGLVWADLAEGRVSDATAEARELVTRFPTCARCLYEAGNAFLRGHDYAAAAMVLEKALLIQPDDAWAHDVLGQALTFVDRDRAVFHFVRAVELEPEVAAHLVHLGDFYQLQKRSDLAAHYYKQALFVEPQGPNTEYILSRLGELGVTP